MINNAKGSIIGPVLALCVGYRWSAKEQVVSSSWGHVREVFVLKVTLWNFKEGVQWRAFLL